MCCDPLTLMVAMTEGWGWGGDSAVADGGEVEGRLQPQHKQTKSRESERKSGRREAR